MKDHPMKHIPTLILLVSILSFFNACGDKEPEVKYINIPEFSEQKKMNSAPKTIQESSQAIVRIKSSAGSGTGFFSELADQISVELYRIKRTVIELLVNVGQHICF